MAYDGEITGLCFWSSIVTLCSIFLSVSQYQSQLGPLAVHYINKHDCPEVHAQLFIMQVSQTEGFVIDLIWNLLGWYSLWGKCTLCDCVKEEEEEAGKLEAEIRLNCLFDSGVITRGGMCKA